MSLPPYSGEFVTCAACGHLGADVAYEETRLVTTEGLQVGDSYLIRGCRRCGYEWKEALVHPDRVRAQP